MKASDELFQLITSLSKSEKRYFKIIAKQQNPDGKYNYLKLFNAIEKQEEYDEAKIIAQYKNKTFVKYLSSEKNYLYNLILKSLNKYYTSSSVEMELDELFNCAKILYKKGLYSQCEKTLNRCLEIARKHELFASVLKIAELQLELIVHIATSSEKMKKGFEQVCANTNEALGKLNNLNEYYQLYTSFMEQIRKKGELLHKASDLSPLNKIIQNPLLKQEEKALSTKAKKVFYFINGTCHHAMGDMKSAYTYEVKGMKQVEAQSNFLQNDSAFYSAKLSNLCETCLRTKEYHLFKMYYDKLKNVPARFPMEMSRQFYRTNDLQARYYCHSGEFEKAIAMVDEIEDGFKEYHTNIHKSRQISIQFYMAYAYLGNNDFKTALKWINKLLNEKTDLRTDILSFARILNCIAHYELDDYLSMESAYRSTVYFFSKKKDKSRLEDIFLNQFKKIHKETDFKKRVRLFEGFKNEIKMNRDEGFEETFSEYFDLPAWLESKIQNKTFAEIINAKNKPLKTIATAALIF